MVFQSYAIWPHMDVWDNVAFPLVESPRKRRPSRKQISARVEKALSVVHLDHLARRRATALSGGQQQRLALARALVVEPPLLLLDEPLSNLDAKLREDMRSELRRLQRELNITTLYVTHDQGEALAMSTSIGVMDRGRLEQIGTPADIYERPASRFVADFVGHSNLLPGSVEHADGDFVVVSTSMGRLRGKGPAGLSPGSHVDVSVRPEHVTITARTDPTGASDGWLGVVLTRTYHGDRLEYQVQVGDTVIRTDRPPTQVLSPGDEVRLELPPEWCWVIPSTSPPEA
jgi:iron(III) transport system ATP-binding protein